MHRNRHDKRKLHYHELARHHQRTVWRHNLAVGRRQGNLVCAPAGYFWYCEGHPAGEHPGEPNRPLWYDHYCQVYLLLPDRRTVWDVTLETAVSAAEGVARETACAELETICPAPYDFLAAAALQPIRNSRGAIVGHALRTEPAPAGLDGLTRSQWRARRQLELLAEPPAGVRLACQVRRERGWLPQASITLDTPYFDRPTIAAALQRLVAGGCRGWDDGELRAAVAAAPDQANYPAGGLLALFGVARAAHPEYAWGPQYFTAEQLPLLAQYTGLAETTLASFAVQEQASSKQASPEPAAESRQEDVELPDGSLQSGKDDSFWERANQLSVLCRWDLASRCPYPRLGARRHRRH